MTFERHLQNYFRDKDDIRFINTLIDNYYIDKQKVKNAIVKRYGKLGAIELLQELGLNEE